MSDSLKKAIRYGQRITRWLDAIMVPVIIVSIISLILDSEPHIHEQWGDQLLWLETAVLYLFTFDYLIRIGLQVMVKPLGVIGLMLQPLMLIDLIIIVPFWLQLMGVQLGILRAFRLIRVFRIFKSDRYRRAALLLRQVLQDKKDELMVSFAIIFVMVIIASVAIYYAEREAQPKVFGNIPSAMWWAVITVTSVGYGDVYPITGFGRLIGSLVAMLGIALFAIPTGLIAAAFTRELEEEARQKRLRAQASHQNHRHLGHDPYEPEPHHAHAAAQAATHLISPDGQPANYCPCCGQALPRQQPSGH